MNNNADELNDKTTLAVNEKKLDENKNSNENKENVNNNIINSTSKKTKNKKNNDDNNLRRRKLANSSDNKAKSENNNNINNNNNISIQKRNSIYNNEIRKNTEKNKKQNNRKNKKGKKPSFSSNIKNIIVEGNNDNNNNNEQNMVENLSNTSTIKNDDLNLSTTTNIVGFSGSIEGNNNMINLPQNFVESLIPSIRGVLSKRDSESYVFNNCNFIIHQNNEITKTNNEVNITENNKIDNSKTTSTSNVNIENTVNNIYNYNTYYNIFDNSFFDYIQRFLDKGCSHKNRKVQIFYKITKFTYTALCISINLSINTLIKAFKISRWTFTQFKDFDKIFKGMIYFIGFVLVVFYIYRSDYFRGIIINYIKSLLRKKSSQPLAKITTSPATTTNTSPLLPTSEITFLNNKDGFNFSNLNGKITKAVNIFAYKNTIKYIIRLSGQKINYALNQTENFVINNSKSAVNYTNKIINTTTPVIKNAAFQFYSAVNTTVTNSIPVLEHTINSTLSFIFNKQKIKEIPKKKPVISSRSEIFKSMTNLFSPSELKKLGDTTYSSIKNSINKTNVNGAFNKLKNIFSNTPSTENIKEMNSKVTENAKKAIINNSKTLKKFFDSARKIIKQERN